KRGAKCLATARKVGPPYGQCFAPYADMATRIYDPLKGRPREGGRKPREELLRRLSGVLHEPECEPVLDGATRSCRPATTDKVCTTAEANPSCYVPDFDTGAKWVASPRRPSTRIRRTSPAEDDRPSARRPAPLPVVSFRPTAARAAAFITARSARRAS